MHCYSAGVHITFKSLNIWFISKHMVLTRKNFKNTYTILRIESLSLMEWRHFLHWATDEWTYKLQEQSQDWSGTSTPSYCLYLIMTKKFTQQQTIVKQEFQTKVLHFVQCSESTHEEVTAGLRQWLSCLGKQTHAGCKGHSLEHHHFKQCCRFISTCSTLGWSTSTF